MRDFDPEKMVDTEYPITQYQPTYFVADSFESAKEKVRYANFLLFSAVSDWHEFESAAACFRGTNFFRRRSQLYFVQLLMQLVCPRFWLLEGMFDGAMTR